MIYNLKPFTTVERNDLYGGARDNVVMFRMRTALDLSLMEKRMGRSKSQKSKVKSQPEEGAEIQGKDCH